MIGKFKVWDEKEKIFVDEKKHYEEKGERFYLNSDGRIVRLSFNNGSPIFIICLDHYLPVHSTGKTDKNGVEVWHGDRLKNKNGHEFTVKHCIEGIETCERIGSKFE